MTQRVWTAAEVLRWADTVSLAGHGDAPRPSECEIADHLAACTTIACALADAIVESGMVSKLNAIAFGDGRVVRSEMLRACQHGLDAGKCRICHYWAFETAQ